MFAADRDLLLLEPSLFRDAAWTGQTLIRGLISTAPSLWTFTDLTTTLDQVGITSGCVVTLGNTSVEVITRDSPTQLTVSRIRADPAAPPIPPGPVTAGLGWITTFAPQLGLVHTQVLRMLGIEPGAPACPDEATESSILNPAALRLLEALGALHLIFAAAGALLSDDHPANQRARLYRQRFTEERQRIVVELDLDGDGFADASRRLNVLRLVRTLNQPEPSMLILNPREVRFGLDAWPRIASLTIDRQALRTIVEWSDAGPHPVFVDVPEQKVTIRVIQDLDDDDVPSPALGAKAPLSLVTSSSRADGFANVLTAFCVVTGITHSLPLARPAAPATRAIDLIAVSTAGNLDPITITQRSVT